MPAAAVKGIILSLSILTALGVAVLENPQIQAWLEQQRQNLIQLLRQLGEELDPQSRRTAEAFAFEGKTPATDEGLRREADGSTEAAAIATGRSLSSESTKRRIPVQGPSDPEEAEERRRKGREYLAQRNQQMFELKQRRKSSKEEAKDKSPPSPTSFDAMVDDEGHLKRAGSGKGKEKELPLLPSLDDVPEHIKVGMREVERNLMQPLLAGEASSSASGWQFGSQLANPFGDEYALDRSETPKPPIPPKVALETAETLPEDPPISLPMPGSFTEAVAEAQIPNDEAEELSYDEQLAIALSLSEAEAARQRNEAAQQMESDEHDADLRAAIAASLKDMNSPQPKSTTPQRNIELSQPLVDLSPSPALSPLYQPAPRGHWESLFDQAYSPTREPLSLSHSTANAEDEEDLYRVTPQLTRARLADLESLQAQAQSPATVTSSVPYDPVREAVTLAQEGRPEVEASFYSAASSARSPATTHTMNHEPEPMEQLIDISEPSAPLLPARTGFETDSDSEIFESVSANTSRAQSRARSEVSNIEVVDLLEDDSDVDMLSDAEGDGIATPDSWTEVGSRDGESEVDEEERGGNWRGAGL